MRKNSKQKVLSIDRRLSEESRQFFRSIHEQHHTALCKFLLRLGVPTGEVEDVAQDVYLRVVRQNEPEKLKEKPRSYLYKVAVNLYRDLLRRGARNHSREHVEFNEDYMGVNLLSPEIHTSAREKLDIVRNAIRELPPQSRQVILMYRFRNLTCEEIALDLDISLRSVQRYLSDAILFCQSRLGGAE